jgi:competence ComEA-like helix-hairpin-helix protein
MLPGVDPALAEAIVAFREEHGSFGTAQDVLDVPGMDAVSFDEVAEVIVL